MIYHWARTICIIHTVYLNVVTGAIWTLIDNNSQIVSSVLGLDNTTECVNRLDWYQYEEGVISAWKYFVIYVRKKNIGM